MSQPIHDMSGKRILIIEDERIMRENVVTLLELEGFEVSSASDGTRGVDLARANPPDLILCDVMMPGLDGHGVLRILREQITTASIPFIFFTAKGERTDVRQGMNLGADDYLTKPVPNRELLAAIAARFERQALFNLQQRFQPDFSSFAPLEKLGLTPREAEVLLWLAQGKTNSDIGIIIECSEATAKRHVVHILSKLNLETRTTAARLAIETLASRRV